MLTDSLPAYAVDGLSGQTAFAMVEARARRSGDTDSVLVGDEIVFTGTAHSALGIAKDVVANVHDGAVSLVTAAGRTLDEAAIKASKF